MIGTWPCPLADGGISEELCVEIGPEAPTRIVVLPPLFDEHNKMRRQLVEVMRRLAQMDVSCVLPDLPGTNESVISCEEQTLENWRAAVSQSLAHFGANRVLAVRSGALLLPDSARGWVIEPQSGARLIRSMIRARTIASREAGMEETAENLAEIGRTSGITLAGWTLGPRLFSALEAAESPNTPDLITISQDQIGGAPLWLRAEPGFDAEQADSLATLILEDLGSPQ